MRFSRIPYLGGLLACLAATGCTVGPDYHRPAADMPPRFLQGVNWRPASPAVPEAGGDIWSIYHDPTLEGLEAGVAVSNQTVRAALAAYQFSMAVVDETRAGALPSLGTTASLSRQGSGGAGRTATTLGMGVAVGWDTDLWGRIRRAVESSKAAAAASAADLAGATLSAQSLLATDYFLLRGDDAQIALYRRSVAAYARALRITRDQYSAGTAARSDVALAQSLLDSTRVQETALGVQRAQLADAIAVLAGMPPERFRLTVADLPGTVPVVPVAVPSVLLQRRPDIAAAERTMAAQNALIGVAMAAYYPDISLSAAFSIAASPASAVFSAANQLWGIGAATALPLFEGGARAASVAAAGANYRQSVALYRATVLSAFQQVEDQLAALRILQREATEEAAAVRSALLAERVALNEYRAGTTVYTNVITAQVAALAEQRNMILLQVSRLQASVALAEAIGGGWRGLALADMPAPADRRAGRHG